MSSKDRRRKELHRRRAKSKQAAQRLDAHGEVVLKSLNAMEELAATFAGDVDPQAAIDDRFIAAVANFVAGLQTFDPYRLIEVARMAYLPWAHKGIPTGASAGPAHVELLALVALAAAGAREREAGVKDGGPVEDQAMSQFISAAIEDLEGLLNLAQLRAAASADGSNQLAMLALRLRGSQVWIRNSSYPEMVRPTIIELFDGNPEVRGFLTDELGFDATTALAVLDGCHDIQQEKLNLRMHEMATAMDAAMGSVVGKDELDPVIREATNAKLSYAFEPDVEGSTVTVAEIAALTGIDEDAVQAVVEQFRLDLKGASPAEVVDAFMAGDNPLRHHPLIVTPDGRMMLAHNALNLDAVKENLETRLKETASIWTKYDKHRGQHLEARTHAALERLVPGAVHRDGVEYFIPDNEEQLKNGDPAKYTKRVEGDHLVLLDDVALIVEDKAVALSGLSKGGKTVRMRTDLTGIITNAAKQSGRLRDAIERDGGVRIQGEGWVDLSHVREIHTVAVSLDDLPGVATANAELVLAGLLTLDNIPWTVSIHDLELIADLIERPAQFLLYLRRRRNPDVTVMFSAPDELDLFLYFYEAGLWVEPDPMQVRAAFPFLPSPTGGELRRYREQMPQLVTSRTDPLDQWFYSRISPEVPSEARAPKPTAVRSPLVDVVDELRARGTYGWISIGATLLEGATPAQHKMASNPRDLLKRPAPNGNPRTLAVPLTSTVNRAEGWLFVWATRPAGMSGEEAESRNREYLRVKKHQLGLPRGAVFLYDESTGQLVDVYYDGHIGDLTEDQSARLASLRAPDAMQSRLHPNAKKPPRGPSTSRPPVSKTPRKAARKRKRKHK